MTAPEDREDGKSAEKKESENENLSMYRHRSKRLLYTMRLNARNVMA